MLPVSILVDRPQGFSRSRCRLRINLRLVAQLVKRKYGFSSGEEWEIERSGETKGTKYLGLYTSAFVLYSREINESGLAADTSPSMLLLAPLPRMLEGNSDP